MHTVAMERIHRGLSIFHALSPVMKPSRVLRVRLATLSASGVIGLGDRA